MLVPALLWSGGKDFTVPLSYSVRGIGILPFEDAIYAKRRTRLPELSRTVQVLSPFMGARNLRSRSMLHHPINLDDLI